MALLGGRNIFDWLGIPRSKEPSITLPFPSSPTSIPFEQKDVEDEKQPFDDAPDKSDSQLRKRAENGLKSLQGKLELVVVAKQDNDAFIYWEFPLWLSQSKLEGRTKPSDACTLIAMSIAEVFYSDVNLTNILRLDQKREGFSEEQHLAMTLHKVCPPELIRLMKEATVKGNNIYDEEKKRNENSVFFAGKKSHLSVREILTIPEAVQAKNRFVQAGSLADEEIKDHSVMHEVDYILVKGSIGQNLPRYANDAIAHPALSDWNIFCFIVVCKEKAVSLVYRRDSDLFCLFDSHAHDSNKTGLMSYLSRLFAASSAQTGSIISISNRRNFPQMAEWMEKRLFIDAKSARHQAFELSLLQLTNEISSINPNIPFLTKIYQP